MTLLCLSWEEPQSLIPQPMLICQCISHPVVLCSHSSVSTSGCCGDSAPCPGSSCSWTVAVGNVLSQSVGKLSDLNSALYFHAIWNSLNICRPFTGLLLLDCTDICEIYLVPFLKCCLHYKYKSRQCFWREINVIVVVVVVVINSKGFRSYLVFLGRIHKCSVYYNLKALVFKIFPVVIGPVCSLLFGSSAGWGCSAFHGSRA